MFIRNTVVDVMPSWKFTSSFNAMCRLQEVVYMDLRTDFCWRNLCVWEVKLRLFLSFGGQISKLSLNGVMNWTLTGDQRPATHFCCFTKKVSQFLK